MSRLDELIKSLCPDGVEFKPLSEVATLKRGARITKKQLVTDGDYFVISGGTEPMGKYTDFNRDANVITISSYGAAGYVDYKKYRFWANDVCLTVQCTGIFDKFLYYYLKSKQDYIYSNTTKAIPDHIPTDFLLDLSIPIPPLEVQQEIARLLDDFAAKTEELQAELNKEYEVRKKQYEYYRDTLLTRNEQIPRVKLCDIATSLYRGAGIKRDQVTEKGIPCVRYGEIYTTYDTCFNDCVSHTDEKYLASPKFFEHGDILFAITGESVEDIAKSIAYLGHDKCLAGGDIVVMKHNQNPRYLAHVLSTGMARAQKSKGKVKNKVVHSSVPSIEQIEIPLPSLDDQKKYADILDGFYSALNQLQSELPAEIESRQKQYEYYRDKLLTFKELNESEVN